MFTIRCGVCSMWFTLVVSPDSAGGGSRSYSRRLPAGGALFVFGSKYIMYVPIRTYGYTNLWHVIMLDHGWIEGSLHSVRVSGRSYNSRSACLYFLVYRFIFRAKRVSNCYMQEKKTDRLCVCPVVRLILILVWKNCLGFSVGYQRAPGWFSFGKIEVYFPINTAVAQVVKL